MTQVITQSINLETCERVTCTECVCRVPVVNVNELGVCTTCIHFNEIGPRLDAFEKRMAEVAK